jgi:hypothetical protein
VAIEDRLSLCMSTSKLVADLQPNVHQVESILQRHQSHLRQSKHCRRTVERSGIVACIIELLLLIVAGFVAKPLEIITQHGIAVVNAHTTRSAQSQSLPIF